MKIKDPNPDGAYWKESHNRTGMIWEYYSFCTNCKYKIPWHYKISGRYYDCPYEFNYCPCCGSKILGTKEFKPYK